ncbi:hypothetical protein ES319_D11G301000v1 [Gossypium barbadense]|uniref:RanBP2-type domain-containing protein n=2 Tax=Gossypium TaxID=3633 RepID=A0A5J5PKR4_GOSBA|nr:hypothetical protein ES319_D11G301000v1 [Gossypium barbadense]TYG47199.1 hypothetical protein ES288_D11G319000v1 [Gossypium darwinii]
MAQSPFTLLLLKRLTLSSKTPLKSHNTSPLPIFTFIKPKLFSSVSPRPKGTASHEPLKPTSLSARLNFVFDQIDQIEKRQQQQSPENDATLQRIRAWRQSRNESHAIQQQFQPKDPDSGIAENNVNATEFRLPYSPELIEPQNGDALRRIRGWRESKFGENKECIEGEVAENESNASVFTIDSVTELELGRQKGKDMEVVHPWPEWIELMERLVQQNYFDHKRRDEGKMVEELGFDMSNVVEEVKDDAGIDFKDFKTVQTACLNFGKDRFDILRSLSRQDIQNLVGFGCPSADKKVVFSAKLLRKHVHLDEGDVCSSCSLRNSCEKAYLLTNKEDEARTVDVMRVLLTYAFHYMDGSAVNESVLKQKSGKTVVRKLLYEIVKLSAVPIDLNLPPPVIKKPPPKVKQPPPPPNKRVGRDDVEMKKGDWLCPKCDFMNFAKNTICLQCDAKRPKRELLPGEWECPECNFLNYRRNMACFHCDCKRPPDAYMESKLQEIQPGPRTRLEKVAQRLEVSNGWNFDFDDDESDGADVAVFEFADSSVKGEASPLGTQTHRGKFSGPEDDSNTADRASSIHERMYSDIDSRKPGIGFDDFDEEDDIDSYEIDTPRNNPRQKASSSVYSDSEVFSELKGSDGSDDSSAAGRRTRFPSYDKPSKHAHKKVALFDSEDELDFDSDEDLLNWKPRHVTDTKLRGRDVLKDLSFDSEDLDLDSNDDDDFDSSRSKRRKENKGSYGRGNFRNRSSGFQGGSFSGSDHEKDGPHSRKNELRQSKVGSSRRGNNIGGYGDYNFRNNSRSRLNTKMDGERNSSDNFNRSYRGSRGDNRRFGDGDYGKQRTNNMEKLKGGKKDGAFGNGYRGKSREYSREMDDDAIEFRNSRRVIER